jgi:voltage-gated potassium channel
MKARNHILIAVGICLAIVLSGTVGYMLLEDYTFFQGLYMSAITISTVGYGEVKPLSPMGQGFSIVLIFSSIVGLALAGRTLGESMLKNTWSGKGEKRKMHKRIQSLRGHHSGVRGGGPVRRGPCRLRDPRPAYG